MVAGCYSTADAAASIDGGRRISQELSGILRGAPLPIIVAGDLIMPVESLIYRTAWNGYVNAFSQADFGYGGTRWMTIKGISNGVRIDHILTRGLPGASRCWVGPDVGSAHLPVLTDIHLDR